VLRIGRIAAIGLILCLAGCTGSPKWPAEPHRVVGPPEAPSAVMWRLGDEDTGLYLQTFRGGVKRVLYRQADPTRPFDLLADLSQLDLQQIRRVFILLDGVGYDVFRELYDHGHFRLFFPPAKMVAPFPSLTDISFSNMFGVVGASCYESVVFNRRRNKLYSGTSVYLKGDNELWATRLDYRQALWMDAVSYMRPMWSTRREFGAMFDTVAEILAEPAGRQDVIVYCLSIDAAGHAVGSEKVCELLLILERYIERVMYDYAGQVGFVMLSDHGNNMVPDCRRVELEDSVEAAGLRILFDSGFKRPGDVVVPRYGLISFLRAFCQSRDDRDLMIQALSATEGVEHVMWFDEGRAWVAGFGGRAAIGRKTVVGEDGRDEEWFSYAPQQGDPLRLLEILAGLKGRSFEGDAAMYYSAADLLVATVDYPWPDPLWRIWHGLTDQTAVVPDLAVSLALGWYYGSSGLDMFSDLNGAHGGLRRADTVGLFASTMFPPPDVMRTTDVIDVVNAHFHWTPPTDDPAEFGLHEYLRGDE